MADAPGIEFTVDPVRAARFLAERAVVLQDMGEKLLDPSIAVHVYLQEGIVLPLDGSLPRIHVQLQNTQKLMFATPFLGDRRHGALQIVGDRKNVPRKSRDRKLVRIFKLAFAALADVLGFSQGPQKMIAHLGNLGFEFLNARRFTGAVFCPFSRQGR